MLLGKALGGGILPLSAVVADERVLGVIGPGQHGGTFGGNALACAVGREVLRLLEDGTIAERRAQLGASAADRLRAAELPAVTAVRQIGLWIAVDVDPGAGGARAVCERLLASGVLCKDTHVVRDVFAAIRALAQDGRPGSPRPQHDADESFAQLLAAAVAADSSSA